MDDDGGGASRSTDPASGSSAATDVSLREYVAAQIYSLDRFITAELAALRRETGAAEASAKEAIGVAAHEAEERLAAHNGLIAQMQALQATYATRELMEQNKEATNNRITRIEKFQYMLTGGILLLAAIGIANLVKVWGS